MATMDVYGFAHEDLRAARKAVESALSISLEEAAECDGSGHYFRWYVPDVRVCRSVAIQVHV